LTQRHVGRLAALILIPVVLLVSSACSGEEAGPAAAGAAAVPATSATTIRLGEWFEPESLNPALRNPAGYPASYGLLMFRGLTRINPSKGYEAEPDLAESWTVSADGLTYTFTLRQDVRWHDGEPFDAEDVVFTFDMIRDPANAATTAADFALVESVQATGSHEVVFKLSTPFAPLPKKLAVAIVPEHRLTGEDVRASSFNQAPVGTGPYRFVEWRRGEFLTLERADTYEGSAPAISRVVISFVPDATTRLQMLNNGTLDVAPISPLDVDRAGEGVNVVRLPTSAPHAIAFNMNRPVWADPAVRLAINFALDRDAMVDDAFGGAAHPATGPLPNTAYVWADPEPFVFDLARSERIMRDAGYERGADGVWARDGQRVEFTLYAPVYEDEAQIAVTSLRQAGFGVTLESADYNFVYSNLDTVDAVMYSFGSPLDPDEIYFLFHSTASVATGGFNLFIADPAIDVALDEGRRAVEGPARQRAYEAFQQAARANPHYGYTVTPVGFYGVRSTVTGVPMDAPMAGAGALGFFVANLAEWEVSE